MRQVSTATAQINIRISAGCAEAGSGCVEQLLTKEHWVHVHTRCSQQGIGWQVLLY